MSTITYSCGYSIPSPSMVNAKVQEPCNECKEVWLLNRRRIMTEAVSRTEQEKLLQTMPLPKHRETSQP